MVGCSELMFKELDSLCYWNDVFGKINFFEIEDLFFVSVGILFRIFVYVEMLYGVVILLIEVLWRLLLFVFFLVLEFF